MGKYEELVKAWKREFKASNLQPPEEGLIGECAAILGALRSSSRGYDKSIEDEVRRKLDGYFSSIFEDYLDIRRQKIVEISLQGHQHPQIPEALLYPFERELVRGFTGSHSSLNRGAIVGDELEVAPGVGVAGGGPAGTNGRAEITDRDITWGSTTEPPGTAPPTSSEGDTSSGAEVVPATLPDLTKSEGAKRDGLEYTLVRFRKACEAVVGLDMREYGPFEVEDVANLPNPNARILIDKKYAEKIEAPQN
ncbi:MAG: DNA replication complex subunit Gins51 [Promethearchaeota archaeon]